jgi:hypothetical protein
VYVLKEHGRRRRRKDGREEEGDENVASKVAFPISRKKRKRKEKDICSFAYISLTFLLVYTRFLSRFRFLSFYMHRCR